MKALRNHKRLTAAVVILAVTAIGAAAYVAIGRNSPSPDTTNTSKSDNRVRRPAVKDPSEIKPGTKVPGTPTSTSPTPPSDATSSPAPKAAND